MRKGFKGYDIVVLGLLVCLTSAPSIVKPVQAQHIDVFKLGPGGRGEISQKKKSPGELEIGTIKVEDRYSYEVPVENDKIEKGDIIRTDSDLVELAEGDKSAYKWHQVEILEEIDITQTHTRIVAGKLNCTRARKGVIYWIPDGTKYVAWDTWSTWSCAKE